MSNSTPILSVHQESYSLMSKEVHLLERCEAVIERGLKTFVEVGKALMEIRDRRLYRDTHETFQDYCKERWGMDRQRAYQLIKASTVAENVNKCLQIPANEGQARELGKLPDEQQAEAWEEAIERTDGKPTAAAVAEVVDEMHGESAVAAPPVDEQVPPPDTKPATLPYPTPAQYQQQYHGKGKKLILADELRRLRFVLNLSIGVFRSNCTSAGIWVDDLNVVNPPVIYTLEAVVRELNEMVGDGK